jgi:hypothetical protein
MPLTQDQAVMLAELAASSRPHGARRWDRAETVAALRKIQHLHLPDVIHAVIRCAEDPEAQSPFAITNTRSPHWRERVGTNDATRPLEPYNPATFCGICSQPEHRCRANRHSGHEFETAATSNRKARRHQEDDQ